MMQAALQRPDSQAADLLMSRQLFFATLPHLQAVCTAMFAGMA